MPDGLISKIEPLDRSHDRAAFSCGNLNLDDYLKRRARQDQARRMAQVYVAVGGNPERIVGYYTLGNFGIDVGASPANVAGRLPRYPVVPAALIGRMAVATDMQGKGAIGPMLLMDAFRNVLRISRVSAVYAVVVHAKNERSAAFYAKYGFIPFPSRRLTMFLPLQTIAQLGL